MWVEASTRFLDSAEIHDTIKELKGIEVKNPPPSKLANLFGLYGPFHTRWIPRGEAFE